MLGSDRGTPCKIKGLSRPRVEEDSAGDRFLHQHLEVEWEPAK